MSFQLSVNGTFSAAHTSWAEKASKTAASATAVALPELKLVVCMMRSPSHAINGGRSFLSGACPFRKNR